jgi:hypothetical protein
MKTINILFAAALTAASFNALAEDEYPAPGSTACQGMKVRVGESDIKNNKNLCHAGSAYEISMAEYSTCLSWQEANYARTICKLKNPNSRTDTVDEEPAAAPVPATKKRKDPRPT